MHNTLNTQYNVLDLPTSQYIDYRRLRLFAVAHWSAMSLKGTLFSQSFFRLSCSSEVNRLLVSLLFISPILLNERSPEKLEITRHILGATEGTAIARLNRRNFVRLSVRPLHGWISQKRCKLESPNLHRRLLADSVSWSVKFLHKFHRTRALNKKGVRKIYVF